MYQKIRAHNLLVHHHQEHEKSMDIPVSLMTPVLNDALMMAHHIGMLFISGKNNVYFEHYGLEILVHFLME